MRQLLFLIIIIFSYSPIGSQTGIPPGTMLLKDNLYIDKMEVSSVDYIEYLYWIQVIFGKENQLFRDAIPDIFSGEDGQKVLEEIINAPLQYPITSISYEQAIAYSRWRSDRVYEMMLVNAGKIQLDMKPTPSNYFTAEKYLAGEYLNYKPEHSIPVPKYRLPTKEEWELAMEQIIKGESKNLLFHVADNSALVQKKFKKQLHNYLLPANANKFNSNGLFHFIGNVAEMTSKKGVCLGGSWKDPLNESLAGNPVSYSISEKWLGFRNVCELHYNK